MTNLIDPTEASALIESLTGLKLKSRQVLYMVAHEQFPKPVVHRHRKLIRFNRQDVQDWVERYFADDSKHSPRKPDAREKMVPTRASRHRS